MNRRLPIVFAIIAILPIMWVWGDDYVDDVYYNNVKQATDLSQTEPYYNPHAKEIVFVPDTIVAEVDTLTQTP